MAQAVAKSLPTPAPPKRAAADSECLQAASVRLKLAREALDLTQEQFAEAMTISATRLANWEVGNRMPNPIVVAKACDRFGLSLDWIYRGKMNGLSYQLATKIQGRPEAKRFIVG